MSRDARWDELWLARIKEARERGYRDGLEAAAKEADRRADLCLGRDMFERWEVLRRTAIAIRSLPVPPPARGTLAEHVNDPAFRALVEAKLIAMSCRCVCGREAHEHFTDAGCDGFSLDMTQPVPPPATSGDSVARAYADCEDVLQRFLRKQAHHTMTVYDATDMMIKEMRLRAENALRAPAPDATPATLETSSSGIKPAPSATPAPEAKGCDRCAGKGTYFQHGGPLEGLRVCERCGGTGRVK